MKSENDEYKNMGWVSWQTAGQFSKFCQAVRFQIYSTKWDQSCSWWTVQTRSTEKNDLYCYKKDCSHKCTQNFTQIVSSFLCRKNGFKELMQQNCEEFVPKSFRSCDFSPFLHRNVLKEHMKTCFEKKTVFVNACMNNPSRSVKSHFSSKRLGSNCSCLHKTSNEYDFAWTTWDYTR